MNELLKEAIKLLEKSQAFIGYVRGEVGESIDENNLEAQIKEFLDAYNSSE